MSHIRTQNPIITCDILYDLYKLQLHLSKVLYIYNNSLQFTHIAFINLFHLVLLEKIIKIDTKFQLKPFE